jgi:uncharacterized protein YkwD
LAFLLLSALLGAEAATRHRQLPRREKPVNATSWLPAWLALLLACGLAPAQEKVRTPAKLPKDVELILKLTNAERAKKELPPLKLEPQLRKAAQKHSENMAAQGRLDHELDGEGPADRARKAGYEFSRLGENIAYGMAAREAVRVWMGSEGHRANILGEQYTQIGIGVAKDAEGTPYYTQVFGKPAGKAGE